MRFHWVNYNVPKNKKRQLDNMLDLLEVLERLRYLLSLARTPEEIGSTISLHVELQELKSDIKKLIRLQ